MTRPSHDVLTIALLHLAPLPGQIAHNRNLIETSIAAAAAAGADWILTPELAVCGYTFADSAGTDWIAVQPDAWMTRVCELAARLRVTVLLSTPERDAQSGMLHNAVFIIGNDGRIAGRHRKINTLRMGSEAWSMPGDAAVPIEVPDLRRVGLLICSDAYSPSIAAKLRDSGAEMLLSTAAWAPGLHGPNGEWERVTLNSGLPLIVCNRTGPDKTMNFSEAVSVVVERGERVLSMASDVSKIFIVRWNVKAMALASHRYEEIAI